MTAAAVRALTDDEILAAVKHGARIANVSDRLGLGGSARKALQRRLQRLEAAGRVERPARLQADNSHFWQVAP